MRLIGLALVMIAAPAAAADQFDLVCKVGASTVIRYRVDVASGEACEAECSRVWRTGAISSGEIRLRDIDSEDPSAVPQTITINRTTGEWRHWIGGGRREYVETGVCEPAAFSGFPKAKF